MSFMYLFVCLFMYLFIYLLIYLFICLFIYLYVYLLIHSFTHSCHFISFHGISFHSIQFIHWFVCDLCMYMFFFHWFISLSMYLCICLYKHCYYCYTLSNILIMFLCGLNSYMFLYSNQSFWFLLYHFIHLIYCTVYGMDAQIHQNDCGPLHPPPEHHYGRSSCKRAPTRWPTAESTGPVQWKVSFRCIPHRDGEIQTDIRIFESRTCCHTSFRR